MDRVFTLDDRHCRGEDPHGPKSSPLVDDAVLVGDGLPAGGAGSTSKALKSSSKLDQPLVIVGKGGRVRETWRRRDLINKNESEKHRICD